MSAKLEKKIRRVVNKKTSAFYKEYCETVNSLPFWKRIKLAHKTLWGTL